jgi:hypothetical protein
LVGGASAVGTPLWSRAAELWRKAIGAGSANPSDYNNYANTLTMRAPPDWRGAEELCALARARARAQLRKGRDDNGR